MQTSPDPYLDSIMSCRITTPEGKIQRPAAELRRALLVYNYFRHTQGDGYAASLSQTLRSRMAARRRDGRYTMASRSSVQAHFSELVRLGWLARHDRDDYLVPCWSSTMPETDQRAADRAAYADVHAYVARNLDTSQLVLLAELRYRGRVHTGSRPALAELVGLPVATFNRALDRLAALGSDTGLLHLERLPDPERTPGNGPGGSVPKQWRVVVGTPAPELDPLQGDELTVEIRDAIRGQSNSTSPATSTSSVETNTVLSEVESQWIDELYADADPDSVPDFLTAA
jgi:hypothetical protein